MGLLYEIWIAFLLCLWHSADGKFVDLSWSLDRDHLSAPPGVRKIELNVILAGKYYGAPWAAVNEFTTAEHIGTHLDAPYHFDKNGKYVDELTFDDLRGPAVVIDIRERAKEDSDAVVTVKDLMDWEEKHGRILDKSWILMHSGWYQHWGDDDKYIGTSSTEEREKWHFPGFSLEAVTWLMENRPGFTGVASDSVSCENGITTSDVVNTMPVHVKLLPAGKLCLENMNNNVAKLPEAGATVFNLPIKLHHGTGGPTRFYAVIGEEKFNSAATLRHTSILMLLTTLISVLFLYSP